MTTTAIQVDCDGEDSGQEKRKIEGELTLNLTNSPLDVKDTINQSMAELVPNIVVCLDFWVAGSNILLTQLCLTIKYTHRIANRRL